MSLHSRGELVEERAQVGVGARWLRVSSSTRVQRWLQTIISAVASSGSTKPPALPIAQTFSTHCRR